MVPLKPHWEALHTFRVDKKMEESFFLFAFFKEKEEETVFAINAVFSFWEDNVLNMFQEVIENPGIDKEQDLNMCQSR